jgi:hypothetical protein
MKLVTNILILIWHRIITMYGRVRIKPCAFSEFAADGGKWSASHFGFLVQSEIHEGRPENKFT